MSAVEMNCHACAATLSVRPHPGSSLAYLASTRGWCIDRGVIACRRHAYIEVMPRHVSLEKRRARAT